MIAPARLLGIAVAALVTIGLVASSRVQVPLEESADALVRVAFSARPERVEKCRTLGERELAELPAHMRQRVVCEGETATYRLEVLRNGVLADTALLRGGGLRRDRQLYVFRELRVPSGQLELVVRMARNEVDEDEDEDSAGEERGDEPDASGAGDDRKEDGEHHPAPATDRERREVEERSRRVADEVPERLELRETVTLAPREVLLITYDQAARRLQTLRGTP